MSTPQMKMVSVAPTVFFAREGDGLRQLVRVDVENAGAAREARLVVRARDAGHALDIDEARGMGTVAPGTAAYEVLLPDVRHPVDIELGLWVGDVLQDTRTVAWRPEKHWEVHLIQYAHHDLGYTDLPSNVLMEYDGFMDEVLRYCEETEDWPDEEARFRYLCEQTWSVIHFIEHRPEEVVEQLVHFIDKGQIEVTALFGNQTLELCGHEELIRLLYPSFRLKRQYGIDISSAEHNDIPGFSWGLASVLAGAGIRYFSPGVPLWYFGRGEEAVHPLWDTAEALPLGMPAACWWEGPDGARVLLWSDLHGGEWKPYGFEEAMADLPGMLRGLDEGGYPYDMVSYTLRGGQRDNAPPTLRYAYMVREWNRRWAYPRLVNTTNRPFLETFEKRWGHALKTLRGDVPGTDYSVAATCTPRETAVDRTTHDGLLAAEKLATLAELLTDYEYPGTALDRAYRDTFYYDLHCWGSSHIGGPAQDAHWSEKGTVAYRAAALSHDVTVKAGNRIADEIERPRLPSGDEAICYLTLINVLSHERTDIARAPLRPWQPCASPMHWRMPEREDEWPTLVSGRAVGRGIFDPPSSLVDTPFELVDVSTGDAIPYQLATLDDPQAARPWAPERVALGHVDPAHLTEIVFAAAGLPSMGYSTYAIVPREQWPAYAAGGAVSDEAGGGNSLVVENRFYRLTVDRESGSVAGLVDRELGRDLVDDDAPHGCGQVVIRSCETAAEEAVRITAVSVCEDGPIYTTVKLRGEASCCPRVTVEITLYHAEKRVDIHTRMLRDSTPMLEVYVAFPFEVDAPEFRFEASGAVIEPLRDQWPGSNTDYYAVQHWAEVFNEEWGVAWTAVDTPMAEFGGLWPGYVSGAHHGVRGPGYGHPFLRPGELDRGHIYSMVSYNNFRTNFVNVHPDEFVVRYAFSSHRGDGREGRAREFGWQVANPPLAVWMEGPSEGSLPVSASFCQIDAPNVLLLALKKAEDGNGYILRVMETEGRQTGVTVTMPYLSIWHAFETNLVEEDDRILPCTAHTVEVAVKPFGFATLRLQAAL